MTPFLHQSPIRFKAAVRDTHLENGWEVVALYEEAGKGNAFVADLSHVEKWEIRDLHPDRLRPLDLAVPQQPGTCRIVAGTLMARTAFDRVLIWHLSGNRPEMPFSDPYTRLTDGKAMLLLWGEGVSDILAGLISADLSDPTLMPPFCATAMLANIPLEIVVLARNGDTLTVLLSVDRAWGQAAADRLVEAGASPAGRNAWLQRFGHQLGIEQPGQG